MIALALQIRILFLLLLAGLAGWLLWRLWQRIGRDPRVRASLRSPQGRLLWLALLRGLLPMLLRLLRGLRFFR